LKVVYIKKSKGHPKTGPLNRYFAINIVPVTQCCFAYWDTWNEKMSLALFPAKPR